MVILDRKEIGQLFDGVIDTGTDVKNFAHGRGIHCGNIRFHDIQDMDKITPLFAGAMYFEFFPLLNRSIKIPNTNAYAPVAGWPGPYTLKYLKILHSRPKFR